ncbi:hypothetical protein NNX13_26415 [Pseudomonas sp. Eb3]|nr:hypothetical protein [Pseudomonas sp. Eb3]MCQ1993351.1 hypothetical protein [Pseudomonas sp. Eb3]
MPHYGVEQALVPQFDEQAAIVRIELRAEVLTDDAQRPVQRHARAVGAGAGHGVEGVTDTGNGGHRGNIRCAEPVGITAAVWGFVVRGHGIHHQRGYRMGFEHAPADFRVRADHRVFVIVQRAGLSQYGIRDADLAQVVNETTQGKARHLRWCEAAFFGQQRTVLGNAPEMAAGVGIAGFHDPGQRQQAGQQGFVDDRARGALAQQVENVHRRSLVGPYGFSRMPRT